MKYSSGSASSISVFKHRSKKWRIVFLQTSKTCPVLCGHQLPGLRPSTPSAPPPPPTPRSQGWWLPSVCVRITVYSVNNNQLYFDPVLTCIWLTWYFLVTCLPSFPHLSHSGAQPAPCQCFSHRCPSACHAPVQICCRCAQPPAAPGLPATGHHAAGEASIRFHFRSLRQWSQGGNGIITVQPERDQGYVNRASNLWINSLRVQIFVQSQLV